MDPLIPSPSLLDEDVLRLFDCFAIGTLMEVVSFEATCLGICQRPENPCIVDIDFTVEGEGVYEIVPELTMFSLDTTNGVDGVWHLLQPIETDPTHSGRYIEVHGSRTCRYVADMCDHVSSFFSEPKICFRITLREKEDVAATFGAFDDSRNAQNGVDPELPNPTVTPRGGCRQRYYGPRLPRA